ncbi:MAG TPA: hypothetical protein VM939_10760 [Gemmatimonadaceae bacterium]|nr:hypothetical protein [Gemmatimonadaceae bacterium]
MEVLNRRGLAEGFPVALFTGLWLLGLTFVALLMSLVRRRPAQGDALTMGLLLRRFGLILVAALWVTLVADQMPCFLGVPNCD